MKSSLTCLAVALALVAGAQRVTPAQQTPAAQTPTPPPTFGDEDVIPFDAAVRTATLPNGLRVFIRRNSQPAGRVSMRLAVKAGSLNEDDDQRGIAHLIEHMAFNGSAHFKPGELVSYFESTGARLGPHLNAYTSFEETVYRLDLPTDRPELLARGLTALADFAGGLTLDPAEIDKERGVVIEEWRLGLGAGSRIRDKQFPILLSGSRYADRLPIGTPETIRQAPAARLRAFYDTWYRPDQMALVVVGDVDERRMDADVRAAFGPLAPRAQSAPGPDRTVPLTHELRVDVATDAELTQSTVAIQTMRPRESGPRVGVYRRALLTNIISRLISDRLAELASRPDAKFLGANAGGGALNRGVATFALRANVPEGRLQEALQALALEARRVREFGFGEAELERAKKTMAAGYERAYAERDKTDSGSYAQEYVSYFLEDEPSPGIAYERQIIQQTLPGVTTADLSALARTLLGGDSRVVLAVSPQKAGVSVPSNSDLQAALVSAERADVGPWSDAVTTRALLERKPEPAAVTERRDLRALGVTIVRFANGVEAWLKPTDFKNDQVLFAFDAPGGASLAPPAEYANAALSSTYVGLTGVGGLRRLDLQKILAGTVATASPYVSLSSHGIRGSGTPGDLETALQLLYQEFTAPNDDPDALALLKRQLAASAANRDQSPQQVFAERLALVNTANHYTAQPLTVARVEALDGAKMMAFYRQRFSNAADFTFVMAGAFTVDAVVPILARYVGSLPSTGHATSRYADARLAFPASPERVTIERGQEPRSQTVISFAADPPADPVEQEQVAGTNLILSVILRDILREELGQTYSVTVGLSQALPQRGGGRIEVRFGSAPENHAAMVDRVLAEIRRLQREPVSSDAINSARETARRSYETSLRENAYWLNRLASVRLVGGDPGDILTRRARIDTLTPDSVRRILTRYFPLDRYTVVSLVPAPAPAQAPPRP